MKEIIIDGVVYLPQTKSVDNKAFEIGKTYFIRTCTYHYTGRVVAVEAVGKDFFALLDECCWIADCGRFSNALEEGIDTQSGSEIEPAKDLIVRVNISAIESIFPYVHKLPSAQK